MKFLQINSGSANSEKFRELSNWSGQNAKRFYQSLCNTKKKKAAISNLAIGKLNADLGEKIIEVCDELILGQHYENFPLSVWQTGSGTQTNMNLNEVIANKANKLEKDLGTYEPIHPNDHCNLGQSSNDSFPTAMHIAIVIQSNEYLIPKVQNLINVLEKKKKQFQECYKNW